MTSILHGWGWRAGDDPKRTITVTDEDGDVVLTFPGLQITAELAGAVRHAYERGYALGRRVGSHERAAEIRKALGCPLTGREDT